MYQQKHTKATTAAVSERKVASRSSSKPSDSFNCMKSGCWGWFGASSLDLLNDLSELQNLKTANGNSLWKKRGLANGRLQPQSDKSRVHHLFLSHHWKRQVVRMTTCIVLVWLADFLVSMTHCLPMTAVQKYWLQRLVGLWRLNIENKPTWLFVSPLESHTCIGSCGLNLQWSARLTINKSQTGSEPIFRFPQKFRAIQAILLCC